MMDQKNEVEVINGARAKIPSLIAVVIADANCMLALTPFVSFRYSDCYSIYYRDL